LEGEVAEAAEGIIRETCNELDIEIIDMAMNVDHVHLFIKYPPKYSVSWIAKRIKGRSSKRLRDQFPRLKEWCPGHLWAPSCYHGSVGHGWEVVERYISGQKGHKKIDTVPVIAEEKEKLRAHKTWYSSLYNKLFGGNHQK
jgi:putative transposase